MAKGSLARAETCPTGTSTPEGPEGYIAWHNWAEEKAKTHRQQKCPGCGLWKIWEPRDG